MNIYYFICIIMSCSISNSKIIKVNTKYPTKRWVTICKNTTTWYQNRSTRLSNFLRENIDVLYL